MVIRHSQLRLRLECTTIENTGRYMDLSISKIRSKFKNLSQNIFDKFHTQNTYANYVPFCDPFANSIKKINFQFNFNFYIFLQSFSFTSTKFYNCTPYRHTAQASLSLRCQNVARRSTQRSHQKKKDFGLVRRRKGERLADKGRNA